MVDEDEQIAMDGMEDMVPIQRRKMKPRGSTANLAEFYGTNYPEFLEEVAKIGISLKGRGRTGEAMKRGLLAYLDLCKKYNKPITNQAAYMAMGITYQTAYDICHGRSGTPDQKEIVNYAKQLCAMNREAMGLSDTVNPILTIFWQKAYDGLNETAEVNAAIAEDDNLIEASADEIIEKYSDLPD